MSSVSDLKIEAKMLMDVEDMGRRIEYEFIDHLLPAPKGIYVVNRLEPVMVDGGEYYTITLDKDNNRVRTFISDITKVKTAVYTPAKSSDKASIGADKQIIPKAFMLNKNKYVSNQTILPYRGIKIVEKLVSNQIDSFVRHSKARTTTLDLVYKHLCVENHEENQEIASRINEIYEDVSDMVRQFMGIHDWHLYFVKLNDTKLTIEKSIDYRAYQWICHVQEQKDIKNGLYE